MRVEPFKREFIVNRQGTDFCLLKGLIDTAHRSGLRRIETRLIQVPTDENGQMAIMHATATFVDADGIEYQFSGIGDATPQNVGRMIVPHILRMAESRSIARALRFGLNVGDTALEELGDETTPGHSEPAAPQPAPTPLRPVPQARQPEGIDPDAPATQIQIDRLHKLQTALGRPAQLTPGLTQASAASEISDLVRLFNNQANGRARQ